jgi:two-component system OmpR family response regulator
MSKGRVLVIDDDEWVCRLLAIAFREHGYEVETAVSTADGLDRARENAPDCIVCDVDLPDGQGFSVARQIRAQTTRVALVPFLFLSAMDDREHRKSGFEAGGDAYLTKPFRIDDVVSQVEALVRMAGRFKRTRAPRSSVTPSGAAMHGDLSMLSAGTILTLLDLERRSGALEFQSTRGRVEFVVCEGQISSAATNGDGCAPLAAVREVFSWHDGRFSFVPHEVELSAGTDPSPINMLLMEAARLEDEANSDVSKSLATDPGVSGAEGPRSAAKSSAATRRPKSSSLK